MIKKPGLYCKCGFGCEVRTKAFTIQPARRLSARKQRFLCFGDLKTPGFQWETRLQIRGSGFFFAADVSKKWHFRHERNKSTSMGGLLNADIERGLQRWVFIAKNKTSAGFPETKLHIESVTCTRLRMAGFPLSAHVGRGKLTPPPH